VLPHLKMLFIKLCYHNLHSMRTLKIYALLLAVFIIGGSKAFAQCTFASITSQPTNFQLCSGGSSTATFTVAASGTGPLNYQWQQNSGSGYANLSNNLMFSGVTTTTLTITNPTLSMNSWDYRCVASAPCGGPAVNSSGASLLIYTQLAITSHPVNAAVCAGGNASFVVTASAVSGNNQITYQWQQSTGSGWTNVTNTGIYTGATTNTLTLTTIPANTFIDYRCFLTGPCDPAPAGRLSNTASISTPPPAAVVTSPANATVCPGQNASFATTATGSGLTYQWQQNTGSGFVNIANPSVGFVGPNSATLTVVGVTAGMAGFTYRCEIKGQCGANTQSGIAALNLNSATAVTVNPANVTSCQGTNVNFSVTATGTGPLSYQWQQWNGSAFVNLAAAPPYQGTTGTTLTIQSITPAMNLTEYRCMVTGACSAAASTTGVLSVNNNPTITGQPLNQTACANAVAGFSVSVAGAGPITYQWQGDNGIVFSNLSNAGIYSGVNTPALVITGATAANNGNAFRCVITGACGSAIISNQASLIVNSSPSINTQPANTMVCETGTANLNVSATGAGLTYQWQESADGGTVYTNLVNAAPFSGATAATLTITGATNGLNGYKYRCVVFGTCTPSQLSSAATLTVNALPVVNTPPSNATVCSGGNTSFTVAATAGGIFYQWQVNTGSGFTNIVNAPPYSGNLSATLSIQNATPAMSGFTYRCWVNGTCNLPVNSASALLTVNTIPTVTVNPSSVTVCPAASTFFAVGATGTGITYQWQVNSGAGFTNLVNAGVYTNVTTPTLTLTGVTSGMTGSSYRCVISGVCLPQATSTAAVLSVNTTPSIQGQPSNTTVCAGTNASFNVTATGTGITYQWQVNTGSGFSNLANTGVYSNVTTATMNITGALSTMTGYQYQCYIVSTCSPILTSAPATLTVNTLPSISTNPFNTSVCATYPTTFAVIATGTGITYQWQVNTGSGFVNATGSAYTSVNSAVLTVTAPNATFNGYTFRCVVGGVCTPSQTSSPATLTVFSLPAVTAQPTSQTTCTNSTAIFSVGGSGTGLTYQWQENKGTGWNNVSNGGVYSGVTSTTLVLTTVPYSMSGWAYRCLISGTCAPAVLSNSVSLSIIPLPTVTNNPLDQTICYGNNATFTVAGQGSSYQWQEFSGTAWVNLTNTGVYNGTNTMALTINAVPPTMTGYLYRCVVGTGCLPNVTSNPATMTVYDFPKINNEPISDTLCEGTTAQFNVNASGWLLEYQWEVNTGVGGWNPIQPNLVYMDPKTATLSIANIPFSMNGYNFRCKITSAACGTSVYSTVVSVGINQKPYIFTQPVVQQMAPYNTPMQLKYYVKAMGAGPFTYQWQVDSAIIGQGRVFFNLSNNTVFSGVTTDTLKITNPPYWVGHRNYRCIVTGLCAPSVTSDAAALIMYWLKGVNNVENTVDVKLYPNPVTGNELNIVIGDAVGHNLNVKISNNLGSLLVNQDVTLDNSNATKINISDLAAGVYNLQVADKDNNLVKTIRFVKQ
jgi:hypothetical protein